MHILVSVDDNSSITVRYIVYVYAQVGETKKFYKNDQQRDVNTEVDSVEVNILDVFSLQHACCSHK